MTNKEAIKVLDRITVKNTEQKYNTPYEIGEALNMAIKALELQEPCEDAVSRQAVLDLVEHYNSDGLGSVFYGYEEGVKFADAVNKLPPVTPTQEPRWIPCSERLPKANGRYLVTRGLNACGAIWKRTYIVNYSDLMGLKSERIWWDGNVGKSDFERIDDVIAWMPLP